jgi:hypothetical protein
MQTIIKYKANTGEEFSDQASCERHEALCAEIDALVSRLPPKQKGNGCDFENGSGYIQHEKAVFQEVRTGLLRIGKRLHPHKWIDQALADTTEDIHPSWVGRLFDDASSPLSSAWHRFLCTDKQLREWGQPFYANNPDKAKQVKLN